MRWRKAQTVWERVNLDPVRGQLPTLQPQTRAMALRATQTAQSPTDLRGVESRVAAMPPIILGKDMAEDLGATVGSVVLVTSPQGELTPFGMVPKYNRFRVVGIFNSGFYDYDSSWAFTRLSDTQQLVWARRSDFRTRVQSG